MYIDYVIVTSSRHTSVCEQVACPFISLICIRIRTKMINTILRRRLPRFVTFMKRNYGNEPVFEVEYIKPKRVSFCDTSRTGDLGIEHGVNSTDYLPQFKNSKELEDASELVKKACTLQYFPRKETAKARGEAIMARVKRHQLDRGSPEVKIAAMTSEIHQLREVYMLNKRDGKQKLFLQNLITKRQKVLKHLRKWDYKRFEWILERLNLIYKSLPGPPKVSGRKDAMRILTDRYCEKHIAGKLDQYRKELNDLKPDFYERKARAYWEIFQDEEKYQIPHSVTKEEVLELINLFKAEKERCENHQQGEVHDAEF